MGWERAIIHREQLARRDFLIKCSEAMAAASLLPGMVARPLAIPLNPDLDVDYHIHPRYREQTPLDSVLVKRSASADEFAGEKYHDRIAAILAVWSHGLRQTPLQIGPITETLGAGFEGCLLHSHAPKPIRTDPLISVWKIEFAQETSPGAEAFSKELTDYFNDFTQILTAEFQVVRIDAHSSDRLATSVRYELVGSGRGFHREQRIGIWELTWQADALEYRLGKWRHTTEMRSRSVSPIFADVTHSAFGANHSYTAQLRQGVDYWRTILDAASGIDIYGHNGVAVGDIDGNGFDDLYVCEPAGLPNRLYKNRGDGTFEDITEGSGLGLLENTACAIFADFDNDGYQDLVVVRANGPLLFLNDGTGHFRLKPEAFQFANVPQGTFTGASAADYDRDGWLDIYFCLYVYYQGTDQYKYPTPYYDANNGPSNFLMRNNRDGSFRDVTEQSGLNKHNTRYSFCCAWTDCNQDGWPDLYVANDFGRKNLYRNNGDGTFTDVAAEAAVEDVGAGMSVCSFDYDNDGSQDFYVADMWTAAGGRITSEDAFRHHTMAQIRDLYRKHAMGNSLFRNKGSGVFEDRSAAAGASMGRWSWSSDAWDFDHDGFPDLYVTNGMISGPLHEDLNSFFWRQVVGKSPDQPSASREYEQGWNAINELIRSDYSWSGYERNVFYANNGDGTFSDVSGAVGLNFIEDGRAFALADVDNDGRLEVLLKNRNGPRLRLLRNVMPELPASISFQLRGTRSNKDAIGASITIETAAGKQTRMLQAGSGFLSQHSKQIFFGLGPAKGPIKASIRWPSGLVQSVDGLLPNHRVFVEEGNERYQSEPFHAVGNRLVSSPEEITESIPKAADTWLLEPVGAPEFSLVGADGTGWTLSKLRGKPVLLHLWTVEAESREKNFTQWNSIHLALAEHGIQFLTINLDGPDNARKTRDWLHESRIMSPALIAPDDVVATYNILYRSLFDRHRDLGVPTSFLINEGGEIVKIYQGALDPGRLRNDLPAIPSSDAARIAKALPFPGVAGTYRFGRNYLSLGSTYFQRGYLNEAAAAFKLAMRDDESSAEAQYGLGSVYLRQSKASEARTCFERAIQLEASYPETKPNAWNNLGLLATRESRTQDAIRSFEEALRLNPEYFISLENLGNAYRLEKRWDEAQRTLERAVSISPEDPQANYSLAMVFAQTDQTERAYSYLQKALQLSPIYPEAINNLGVLYLRTQRRDLAVAEFEKCIRLAPAFDQSYLNLARVYAIEGDRAKARETLLALLKQHPDQLQAQRALDDLK